MLAWKQGLKYFTPLIIINTLLATFIAIISDTRWGAYIIDRYPVVIPIGIIAMIVFILITLLYASLSIKKSILP